MLPKQVVLPRSSFVSLPKFSLMRANFSGFKLVRPSAPWTGQSLIGGQHHVSPRRSPPRQMWDGALYQPICFCWSSIYDTSPFMNLGLLIAALATETMSEPAEYMAWAVS